LNAFETVTFKNDNRPSIGVRGTELLTIEVGYENNPYGYEGIYPANVAGATGKPAKKENMQAIRLELSAITEAETFTDPNGLGNLYRDEKIFLNIPIL
jgi:hypothetical protein